MPAPADNIKTNLCMTKEAISGNAPDFDPYAVADGDNRLWNRNYVFVMLANFLLFFSLYNLMPILPIYLADELGAGRDIIGEVMGGFIITGLMIRPFSGYIVDSFPRKKVLMVCYLVFSLFNIGFVASTTVLMFGLVRTLQGFAFGSTSVANSTVAIDVLPSSRRSEGIGYYGISNNLAMAIGPSVALALYNNIPNRHLVFAVPLISSLIGFACIMMVKNKPRAIVKNQVPLSFDRFFLKVSLTEGFNLIPFAFASATLTTYLAIYGKQELGIYSGSGVFFLVLSVGLILSRVFTNKWVRRGYIIENVKAGMILVVVGFLVFVGISHMAAFYVSALIIGLGYGTMCPSYQSMFINLAPNSRRGTANSSYLTSWDVGAGIGIFSGGYIAERTSYHFVYWICFAACVVGALIYFAYTSKHFNRLKIR